MIITDEKILRMPCVNVLPEEIGELRNLLETELANSARLGRPGIGLSLPQIGIHKKMAIIRLGSKDQSLDIVNSHLIKGYDEFIHVDEGCLSFPNRSENVKRYQEIYVGGNLIYPHSFILTGLMAVCYQHESDHLNGILLPDRAIPKLISVKKKQRPNDLCECGSKIKYKKCCGK